jgi:1,5-anhydro-D-fructose reductase (1,5-anhydro-D-mannitol-forming)
MLNVAILGPGRFAAARLVNALNRAGNTKLIAIVGRDRERADTFAEEYGIPRAYDDLGAALADREIEAVWVATPHALHREQVEQIAAARKHVLCEKPLATTVEDAATMVRACRRAGVLLGTGFHLRHHPLHREVRRIVTSGGLGQIAAAEAEWSLTPRTSADPAPWRSDPALSGGGIVMGTGVHAIDLLRFVLDDEVAAVTAFTNEEARQAMAALNEPGRSDLAGTSHVDTRALALLRFRGGTFATVRCNRGVFAPSNDLLVQATGGTLIGHRTLDELTRGTLEANGVDANFTGVPAGSDMYALEAQAFVEAVQEGNEPDASGEDGLRVAEITAALYESARTGRTVSV